VFAQTSAAQFTEVSVAPTGPSANGLTVIPKSGVKSAVFVQISQQIRG